MLNELTCLLYAVADISQETRDTDVLTAFNSFV